MRFLLTCIPATALFCIGATHLIDLPGIYMDSVNVDYMAVHILHPCAIDIPIDTFPGNLIGGLFPILGFIYYGALPLYFGLPFYWLLGTGVEGIRLANVFFGLIVLASCLFFLRSRNIRPLISAIAIAALAIDPGFLFVWRTQFNITLLPLAPLLASVALTELTRERTSPRVAILAGWLAGVACYGYFIYCFLVPSAFIHKWNVSHRGQRPSIVWWLVGFAGGVAPYALAAVMLWHAVGSAAGFVSYLRGVLGALNPGASKLALFDRIPLFFENFRFSILGIGPKAMMIAEFPSVAPNLRLILLVGIPVCGLILWVIRKAQPPGLPVLAGFVLGLFFLAIAFGNRLWLHHFVLLVPILYLGCASVSEAAVGLISEQRKRYIGTASTALLFSLLIGLNIAEVNQVFGVLKRTKGVGYSSEVIDKFAIDSLKTNNPTFYFFPDWGVFMPFVMLTEGSRPYRTDFDVSRAHALLCGGKDVVVVTVLDKEPERLRSWSDALKWTEPVISTYRQADGSKIVLTVARWKADMRPTNACS